MTCLNCARNNIAYKPRPYLITLDKNFVIERTVCQDCQNKTKKAFKNAYNQLLNDGVGS